jgi:hypothetical protein
MKTWQAFLMTLGIAVGGAVVPTLENKTTQAGIAAAVVAAAGFVSQTNSKTDPNGNPLVKSFDGSFTSKVEK